jgi:hypothetical protein
MTSQEIQDRVDALVTDLQTKGKGKSVNVMFRGSNGQPNILPLSSDANGVVNASQLAAIQAVADGLKTAATDYYTATAPYTQKAYELDAIRRSAAYQNARAMFAQQNVVENYNELANAKGNYVS